MTIDERIDEALASVDHIATLQLAGFEEAIEAAPELDADDRAALMGAWRAAWTAERCEVIDRLRVCARLMLGAETVH